MPEVRTRSAELLGFFGLGEVSCVQVVLRSLLEYLLLSPDSFQFSVPHQIGRRLSTRIAHLQGVWVTAYRFGEVESVWLIIRRFKVRPNSFHRVFYRWPRVSNSSLLYFNWFIFGDICPPQGNRCTNFLNSLAVVNHEFFDERVLQDLGQSSSLVLIFGQQPLYNSL